MSRQILVHLNLALPASDRRSVEEIVDAIEGALQVGSDHDSMEEVGFAVALAEEIS